MAYIDAVFMDQEINCHMFTLHVSFFRHLVELFSRFLTSLPSRAKLQMACKQGGLWDIESSTKIILFLMKLFMN